MTWNVDKGIKNIIGKKSKAKDVDGDGVPDKKDCQPKNVMRQDYFTDLGPNRLSQMVSKKQIY